MTSVKIIFEDEWILAVDKPWGLVVNRSETTTRLQGSTLQDWAERKFTIYNLQFSINDPIFNEFKQKSGIVHRLDKDTSGVLVIAKTIEAYKGLKVQFQGREVTKKYLALVHGKVEPAEGTINAPIERNPFNRKHFGVFPGGRLAETKYKLLKMLKLPRLLSLLEIEPKTGRTHQIRVHMKYINHPVVSDPIYGGRKQCREDLMFCPRLFLHAQSLKIRHPETGEVKILEAELPDDLKKVLDLLD